MNILRTIPFFYPYVNGPTKEAYELSVKLAARKINSQIITTYNRAEKQPAFEEHDGWSVQRYKETVGMWGYRHAKIDKKVYEMDVDLVYAHLYRNYFTTFGARIARKKGIPIIVQPHGTLLMYKHIHPKYLWGFYRGFDRFQMKKELKKASGILVSIGLEKEEAIRVGLDGDKVHVIPFGCDEFEYEDRVPIATGDRLKLLFVGRIAPDRKVEMIIEAICQLPKHLRDQLKLSIVGPMGLRSVFDSGDKYKKLLVDMVESNGLQDCVEFVGALYGDDLIEAYKHADLFLYTSDYENFGQTVLEAASYGCPVLATPTGVAADIVRDDKTGYLVPFNDSLALKEKIEHLVNQPDVLKRMSLAMHELAHSDYSWDTITTKHIALYESVMS